MLSSTKSTFKNGASGCINSYATVGGMWPPDCRVDRSVNMLVNQPQPMRSLKCKDQDVWDIVCLSIHTSNTIIKFPGQ